MFAGLQVKIIAALVLAAVLVGGFFYIKSLRSDLALAEAAAAQYKQAAEEQAKVTAGLMAERDSLNKLLAERELARSRLLKEREKLNERLRELEAADPAVRAWAGQPVPGPIADCVRRDKAAGCN